MREIAARETQNTERRTVNERTKTSEAKLLGFLGGGLTRLTDLNLTKKWVVLDPQLDPNRFNWTPAIALRHSLPEVKIAPLRTATVHYQFQLALLDSKD